MKQSILILVVTLLFTACRKESIRGGGAIGTEIRNIPSFNKVSLQGDGEIDILQGATQEVKVTGYENLLAIYETRVVNGTLILKFNEGFYSIRNNNLLVQVILPDVSGASINGSGNIRLQNFNGSSITAEINGSGKIQGTACKFNEAVYRINGSGNISARGIEAKVAEANISGSGYLNLTCIDRLNAKISGSGTLDYYGNPPITVVEVSGSGRVTKK